MTLRSNQIDGMAETYAMLGALPQAAQEQIGVEMAIIGYDVLRAQQADVARDTGALAQALSLKLELDQLRVRIGLLNVRNAQKFNGRSRAAVAGGPFYGRFVEYGRRGQTVTVTRHLKRSIKGDGRTSKRRVIFKGKPYSLKVKAMAPRPYVHKDRPEIRAEQRLANFWAEVLGRTGAA